MVTYSFETGTVESQSNNVPRVWGNCFITLKVCYIVTNLYRGSAPYIIITVTAFVQAEGYRLLDTQMYIKVFCYVEVH